MSAKPELKPIQTKYNGYHFRSRLEARWAVFFDALQIPYEYEPEGFETECGRYLPDFRISNCLGYYVEIKPDVVEVDDRWLSFAQHKVLMLLCGQPFTNTHTITLLFRENQESAYFEYRKCCRQVALTLFADGSFRLLNDSAKEPKSLLEAYEAARSARFEHLHG